jgi:hypothetical protein
MQRLQYWPNKEHNRWGVKLWVLCNWKTNYCLAFYVYQRPKRIEHKNAIQKDGLIHTFVIKLRKLENCTFLCSIFITFLLAKELYKLGIFVTGSIRRNRKFPPMLFGTILNLARKIFLQRCSSCYCLLWKIVPIFLSIHSKTEYSQHIVADHFSIFSRFAGICHERCMACVINLSWQRMFGDR